MENAYFCTVNKFYSLKFKRYEKEIKQKKQKIGENVWKCRTFNVPLPMSTRRERAKEPTTKLNKQLVQIADAAQKAESKKEIERNLSLWKSELFTDMAKLVFAGVILGGVFEKVENPMLLYGSGFLFLAIFLYMGYLFMKRALKQN